MATYEIEVLEKADEDMRLLGKYISGELQSPMAAERITDKIWDEIEKLAKNPYVYQVYIPLEEEVTARSVRIAELMKNHEHGVLETTTDKILIDFVSKKSNRTDTTALKKNYPTVYAEVVKTSESRKLNVSVQPL